MISTGELQKGVAIELDGDLWQILDYHHIKMGRGSAQVRITLRNIKRGQTVERSFQAGTKWPRASMERRPVQFLYRDGDDFHFMDTDTYDQFVLTAEQLDDAVHVPQGRDDPRPDELPGRDDRGRAAGHGRPRGDRRPSRASPATPRPARASRPRPSRGLVVTGADLRRGGRHHPGRHPDRRVPDPGLTPRDRPRAAGLGAAGLGRDRDAAPRASRRRADAGRAPGGPSAGPIVAAGHVRADASSAVSDVTRAVREARPRATTGCATCGSRARWAGSPSRAPATPTSRSRTSAASSSASGSAMSGWRRPSSPGRGCGSSPTAGSTCSMRTASTSSTSAPSSRRASATSRCASRRSRRSSAPRACSTPTASGRCPTARPSIAVVTSETGAVWHDIRNVLARRWPLARVVLSQCQVQGAGAPVSIVRALSWVDRYAERCVRDGRPGDAPTVTILARGGGSLEDLWSFNDEPSSGRSSATRCPWSAGSATRPTSRWPISRPIVRAPTPSAAAEIVVPDRVELAAVLAAETRRLEGAVRRMLAGAALEASAERRALDGLSPVAQLAASRERAGLLLDRATRAVRARLELAGTATERAAARLRPSAIVRLGRRPGRGRRRGCRPGGPRTRGDPRTRLRDRPPGTGRADPARPCRRAVWRGPGDPRSRGARSRPRSMGRGTDPDRRPGHRSRHRRRGRGRRDRPWYARGAADRPPRGGRRRHDRPRGDR